MKWAIEQAGSRFTGWISSCLFCPSSGGDAESFHHEKSMKQKGAEREMKICHTQSHLVPPMQLGGSYDLPCPSPPPRVTSLPSWVMDGKGSASRSSIRASMSFKRKSAAPLRISAPSEFRRVPLFATTPKGFRPLELGFDTPGHRLPELPSFEEFGLEEDHRRPQPIARLPRTLVPSADISRISRSRSHGPSSSYNLPRKPVGSGSRRSSLATLEQLMEKPTTTTTTPVNPLVPYFSTRSSAVTGPTTNVLPISIRLVSTGDGFAPPLKSEPPKVIHGATTSPAPPRTPTNTHLQDRPSLPSIPSTPSDSSHHGSTTPKETRPTTAPSESPNPALSRSGRVTQWLFQTSNRTLSPSTPWKGSSNSNSNSPEKNPFRFRSRTLSGSTVASSISSMTAGFKTTPSLSSNITAATTARASNAEARTDKDLELPFSRPPLPKQPIPSLAEEPTYPTIHETQQQQDECDDFQYNYYENYRRSAVGLAF